MTDTPLSDLITSLRASLEPSTLRLFHTTFLESWLGVTINNVPKHARPGMYRVAAGDNVTMNYVQAPDGRLMVKACADPRVFVQRYDPSINARMLGRELLEMVLKVPELEGVLVCSAASFHSVPIAREDIPDILGVQSASPKSTRQWWKFWQH